VTRILGAVLLVALAVHALTKLSDGTVGEMLFTCHVASVLLAVGLLTRRHLLVAVGFLFHLGVGLPTYLLDAAVTGRTTASSVLVHLLPLLAGGLEVRRRGLPRAAALWGLPLYAACALVSWFATDPALNVNLVRAPWGPTRFLGREGTWFVNGVLSLMLPLAADRVWRRTLGRDPLPLDDRAL